MCAGGATSATDTHMFAWVGAYNSTLSTADNARGLALMRACVQRFAAYVNQPNVNQRLLCTRKKSHFVTPGIGEHEVDAWKGVPSGDIPAYC